MCVCVCVLQAGFRYDLTSCEQLCIIEQGFSNLALLIYKPDNSLLWEAVLCIIGGLAAPVTSTR